MTITWIPVLTWEKVIIMVLVLGVVGFITWRSNRSDSIPESSSDKIYRWVKGSIYGIAFFESSVFFVAVLIQFFLPSKLKSPWVAIGIAAVLNWLGT